VPSADPLVSAIMPVSNGAAFLAEAAESVLAQTHAEVELVVIDDGSTDASAAIAAGLGPRVRCGSTPGLGPAAARNAGLAMARGEFVTFIDADDRWPADRVATQLAAFERSPAPDIVFGHLTWFPGRHGGPQPSRRTFDAVGPLREQWRLGDFMEWLLRARELGMRELMLPDVVLERRIHGENLTMREPERFSDYARILRGELARRRAGGA
jgi:glycosyltransferase involved in cell wall biosynthesis